ncbi:hypothetical protein AgCh_028508 [Apium graveolens]
MKIYNLRFRQAYLPQIFSLQASWSNTKASRSKIRFQFGGFDFRGSFDVGFSFLENEFQSEYSKRVYGESLDAQPDPFLCSINDVKVNNGVDQRARNVVPGIEGFLRQKLSGQGLAFIVRGGSGEVLVVDVSSIIALSGTVDVHIKFNGRMRRVVFGISVLLCIILYSQKNEENLQVVKVMFSDHHRFNNFPIEHVIPGWHEHWTSNKVYDGDMIVLQG